MLKIVSGLCLFIALTSLKLWASPPEETVADPTVAIINGKAITQQDYDTYFKARMEQTSVKQAPDRAVIIKELVNRQLVIQDALKKQLDKTPTFERILADQRESLLATVGMQDYLDKHPLSEAALKAEYDKRVKQADLPKEYQVKHILVETEATAKAIISALEAGEKFEKLAKEKSTDPSSAEQGGDLGWLLEQQVAPAFATAMIKLKKGKYTKSPVQTQFGWHVLLLEDTKNVTPPAFEKVKKNLEIALQTQKMQEYVEQLRKVADIKISDLPTLEKATDKQLSQDKPTDKQAVP